MRRVVLLALAILLGVAVGMAGAMALRGRQLAEAALHAALSRAGLAAPTLAVRSVGLDGLTLGPMRLGEGGPSATAVELGWSPLRLLAGRIEHARIEGLKLGLAVDQGGIRVVGLPELAGGARAGLPVGQLTLADAKVTVRASAGEASMTVAGSLSQAEPGMLSGQAKIDATLVAKGETPVRIIADLPGWTLDLARQRIAVSNAAVRMPDQQLEADTLEASVDPADVAMPFRLAGRLRNLAKPPAWPALTVALNGRREKDTIMATGEAQGADRTLTLKLKASHALDSGRGKAEIELAPLRFQPDRRQPADLFPAAGRSLALVTGTIGALGTVQWDGRGLRTALRLDLAGVGFDSGSTQLRELAGRITLEPAWPPRTVTPQRLTARLAVAGLPPGAVELVFTLPDADRLRIERASFGLAGGTLSLAGATLRRDRPLEASIAVEAVDVGAALALLNIDGLSGSGRLGGRIPVLVDAGSVVIRDGRLAGDGPGTLRYTGQALPAEISGLKGEAGDAVRLAQQALADFHYTDLKLAIDRAADGGGSLLLNLSGNNPAVLDGHPFVLNIRLETNFDRLALLLLDGYAAAEGMLRRSARP